MNLNPGQHRDAGCRGLNLSHRSLAMIGLALYLGRPIFIPTIIALLFAAMMWPRRRVAHLHEQGVADALFAVGGALSLAAALGLSRENRKRGTIACMFLVGVLITVALGALITLGFVLAIPKILQALPNDRTKSQAFYGRFRQRLQAVSPVPLDPTLFPEKRRGVMQAGAPTFRTPSIRRNRRNSVVDTLRSLGGEYGTGT